MKFFKVNDNYTAIRDTTPSSIFSAHNRDAILEVVQTELNTRYLANDPRVTTDQLAQVAHFRRVIRTV